MIKNKDVKGYIEKHSIEDMFTYVNIDEDAMDKISQEIKDDWGLDEYIHTLTLADAYTLVEKNEIDYSDIDYDFCDWDEWAYKDFIHELVKKAEHYLVYLPNSTWRGSSGCGIVDTLEDAFCRGYDCTQYVKGVSKGNKAVLLRESHHDVPMGHHALIIALTDKEYNKLENADFKTLEDFALKYMYLETNKRELLKTIVNL